jgi:hypothetical protein
MDPPAAKPSCVGVVYLQRRKLLKRRALCVRDEGDQLVLHLSAKEPTMALAAEQAGDPDGVLPTEWSPAARLWRALRMADAKDKVDWEVSAVQPLLEELLGGIGARRYLANEAVRHGWRDVLDDVDLSVSEKAWLLAHQAAVSGDLDQLAFQLAALPAAGYEERVGLLFPYLPALSADRARWEPVVQRMVDQQMAQAADLRTLAFGELADAAGLAFDRIRSAGYEDRAEAWRHAADLLVSGRPAAPLGEPAAAWSAAAVYAAGQTGERINEQFAQVATTLPMTLLDDLIDHEVLTAAARIDLLEPGSRRYVLARVDPIQLSDEDLRTVGHMDEIARRAFLRRNRTMLDNAGASEAATHYGALLDVVEGRAPDGDRLRDATAKLLRMVHDYRTAAERSEVGAPPDVLLDDQTLWPLVSESARAGKVALDPQTRAAYPNFADWADLQRLVGLIWEGDLGRVADTGRALASRLSNETMSDEALSLTAYALSRLGRDADALQALEEAMRGAYTESLLVNASIVATEVDSETALRLFARLVDEAPTIDLAISSLRRGIALWELTDASGVLPSTLVTPLRRVLAAGGPLQDYCALLRTALSSTPQMIIEIPRPAGECAGPYDLFLARAQFVADPNFAGGDLGRAVAAVYQRCGRVQWFDAEWSVLAEASYNAVFVPFGDALHAATFWDELIQAAPDLPTLFHRMVMLPQAGVHIAFSSSRSQGWLSPDAFNKFFFRPIAEFLANPSVFADEVRAFVGDNFSRTLTAAVMMYVETQRDSAAEAYNPLAERLRWDAQHFQQIRSQMRDILGRCTNGLGLADGALDLVRRLPAQEGQRQQRVGELTNLIQGWRTEMARLRGQL